MGSFVLIRLFFLSQVIAGSGVDHGKVESKSGINKLKSSDSIESTKQETKPEPPKPNPPAVSKVFTDLFGSPLTKEDITTAKKTASKPTSYASSKVSGFQEHAIGPILLMLAILSMQQNK